MMPEPFLAEVSAQIDALTAHIALLKAEQEALGPTIYALEQQRAALTRYRQSLAQDAVAEAVPRLKAVKR